MCSHLPAEPNFGQLSSRSGKYATWRGKSLFRFNIGAPTDEFHLFTKGSKTTTTNSTVLLSGTRQISFCLYY